MPNTREKLIDLLYEAEGLTNNEYPTVEMMADYLLAHGVTFANENKERKNAGYKSGVTFKSL